MEVDAGSLVTGETVAVAFISPQGPYLDDTGAQSRSYAAAIDRDGTLRAVRTAPMQGGTPVWSGGQVFAADRDRDYRFSAGAAAAVEHRKPDAQVAAYPLPGADAFGAIYNDGWGENGYHVVASATRRDRFADTALDGSYLGVGLCPSGLIGVAVDEEAGSGSAAHAVETVSRIDPVSHRLTVLIRTRVDPEALPFYTQRPAPCGNGTVTAIVDSERPEQKIARLRQIDAASGRSTVRALTDESGAVRRFDLGDHGIDPVFSRASHSRDALDWVNSDGVVWRTDLATARTRRLFDTGANWVSEASAFVDITRRCVVVLTLADDGEGRLQLLRRPDGALLHTARVPGLREILGDRAGIEGFAAKPTL